MATYIVTTLNDELDSGATEGSPGGNGLSLREAIALANANGGGNIITFASNLSGGTITIDPSKGRLQVTSEMTIVGDIDDDGAPDITLDGGGVVQIMHATQALAIDGLIMTGGRANVGGAIYAAQGIHVENSAFIDNQAPNGLGGAIAVMSGIATIEGSTFEGNESGAGGAVYSESYSAPVTVNVTGSTFSGNIATGQGGAIASWNNTTAQNTTFYGNTANSGAALYTYNSNLDLIDVTAVANVSLGWDPWDAIFGSQGSYTTFVTNSILIGNAGRVLDVAGFYDRSILDANSPYASNGNVTVATVGDVFVVDANGAAVLADNGGPVKTVALNPDASNPALDAGGLAADARGVEAVDVPGIGSAIGDLGAYEYATRVVSVDAVSADGTYWLGQTIALTVIFDGPVLVTGVPTLLLETGTTDRQATYVSGSGTNTLTFQYTVQAGDTASDLDFASTAALSLSGGTLTGQLNDAAIRTLPAPGSTYSLAGQANLEIHGVLAPAAPVLANALPDQAATEDSTFNFTIPANSFTDINNDTLTYTATLADGSALPSWLSLNATTGTFSGTPDNAHVGTISIKITAADGISGFASDTFSLTVANTNDAPAEITLSSRVVAENSAAGTVVGSLVAIDPDLGDAVTLSLTGTADGRFTLVGNQLVVAQGATLDFETARSHAVTVRATDATGATLDKTFTIDVSNVNEAPTAIELSASRVSENARPGTIIGDLIAIDPDLGDTATFTVVGDARKLFAIADGQLTVARKAIFDFDTAQSHDITIRATDAAGATFDQTLTISVMDSLIGNRRANALTGADADELLDGGAGNDRLTGNGGADTFVLGKGYGRDTITDFDASEGDVIDLSAAIGIRNFRDLMRNHVEDTGKDLVITADDGSALVLRGIDADDLGKDSFLF